MQWPLRHPLPGSLERFPACSSRGRGRSAPKALVAGSGGWRRPHPGGNAREATRDCCDLACLTV
eukprot:6808150-Alexandrium_andersonii.AAC.1